MNLADLPSSLTITNLGPLDLGIANIRIPVGSPVTVDLSAMGPARRSDIWLATYAAVAAGLVTTSATTGTLTDAWHSAHHYRAKPPLHLGVDGQSSPSVSESGQTVVNGGQGENFPDTAVPPPVFLGPPLDFSDASNSQFVSIILYI